MLFFARPGAFRPWIGIGGGDGLLLTNLPGRPCRTSRRLLVLEYRWPQTGSLAAAAGDGGAHLVDSKRRGPPGCTPQAGEYCTGTLSRSRRQAPLTEAAAAAAGVPRFRCLPQGGSQRGWPRADGRPRQLPGAAAAAAPRPDWGRAGPACGRTGGACGCGAGRGPAGRGGPGACQGRLGVLQGAGSRGRSAAPQAIAQQLAGTCWRVGLVESASLIIQDQ